MKKNKDSSLSNMDIELEYVLKVPPDVMFPLEMNVHLREVIKKLTEEKWALKEKLDCEGIELKELQKYKDETKQMLDVMLSGSNSLMSSKLMELSKKTRDMCWQNEGMKTKLAKLMAENDCFREKIKKLENSSVQNDSPQAQADECDGNPSAKSEEEFSHLNYQLTKVTNKMMEYRRQSQVMQQELKTALRALAQEVGDGVTPKTVLKEIASVDSTWRGRQQQIMTLQQKLMEAQLKISSLQGESISVSDQQHIEIGSDAGEPSCGSSTPFDQGAGDFTSSGSNRKVTAPIPVASSASKRCLANLQQHDMKKREQIEKLTEDLETAYEDLKTSKLEAKGLRARNHVLEGQIRTLRIELDDAASKLNMKQELLAESGEEVQQLRAKLLEARDKEKEFRDNTLAELKEANQSLNKERGVVLRLQKMLAEKEETLLKMDGEIARLNDDLQIYAKNSYGTLEASQKIKSLETQLQYSTQSIQTAEKERERLLNALTTAMRDVKSERRLHCETEILLNKSISVLKKANDCVTTCLDAGNVTALSVLKEVEDLRTSIRQINARHEVRSEEAGEAKKSSIVGTALSKEADVLNDFIKSARSVDTKIPSTTTKLA